MREIELCEGMKLRSVDSMNWELMELRESRRGKDEGSVRWFGTGRYYQGLSAALEHAYERAMLRGEGSETLEAALAKAERIAAELAACAAAVRGGRP